MEFNSNIINFLKLISEKPEMMVFGTAFGIPLCIALLSLVGFIFRNIKLQNVFNPFFYFFVSSMCICWIIGFVTQISFLFIGLSGIKMFAVWITMITVYSLFVIVNYGRILKWTEKFKN
ncbi:hypothetical protein [Flavobacterium oreochromis]|uniref:hypothetical protein n=1 Tax=Flavobacterium oreochromis TaxID=2906078 RepID=UPI000B4DA4DC|nr:hypothetical protein [Flavobacterium oreochromis]OWP74444.1 hypothetical protein BWG23_13860 [Flavobacterium oreochromis]